MHSYIYYIHYLYYSPLSIADHDDISLSIQCSVNYSHSIILVEINYDVCNEIINAQSIISFSA